MNIRLGQLREIIERVLVESASHDFEKVLVKFLATSHISWNDALQGLTYVLKRVTPKSHGLQWEDDRLVVTDQSAFDSATFDKDYKTDAVMRELCKYLLQNNMTLTDALDFITKELDDVNKFGYKWVKQGNDRTLQPDIVKTKGAIPMIDMEFPKGSTWGENLSKVLDGYDLPKLPQRGAYIASGMQGAVYTYGDDKVIKIATTSSTSPDNAKNDGNIRSIIKAIRTIRDKKPDCVASVFGFDVIAKFRTSTGIQYVYYIISEKLLPIKGYLPELPNYPEFEECLKHSGLNISDIDGSNVMQTADGQLKVVDYGFVE